MNSKLNQNDLFAIEARGLSKKFDRHILFKNLSLSLETGNSLAATGPNGSGKSTLLEIIACLCRPTMGEIRYTRNGNEIPGAGIHVFIGFSSFRINPYNELTGLENIHFILKDGMSEKPEVDELLSKFNLYNDREKRVKHYSSGMKQRLRFLLAILHDPPVLFLDEPGANLDRPGKDIIYSYIKSIKKEKIIFIATNEEEEADLCNERIKLGR